MSSLESLRTSSTDADNIPHMAPNDALDESEDESHEKKMVRKSSSGIGKNLLK